MVGLFVFLACVSALFFRVLCSFPLNGRGNPPGGWLNPERILRGSARQLCCFRWLFESAKKVATSYTTWSPPFFTVIFTTQNKKLSKIR